jgi:hypothetical protein
LQRLSGGAGNPRRSVKKIFREEAKTAMTWVADVLDRLGVTGREHGTTFPDGAAFRIEIPSVEGPKVFETVLRAAEAEGIAVNRVSQGSGAVLLRATEQRDMAQAGLEAGWRSACS